MGDLLEEGLKNRQTLDKLLLQGREMLDIARDGTVEIYCESETPPDDYPELVWSMTYDEYKKGASGFLWDESDSYEGKVR